MAVLKSRRKSDPVKKADTMRKEVLAVIVVIVVTIAFVAGVGSSRLYSVKTISATTTVTDTFAQTVILLATSSSATCYYVIPGPCPSGQTFSLTVNYTGSWRVTYQGYNTLFCSGCLDNSTRTLIGSYDGSGSDSRNITVGGQGPGWTLCAQAQKTDPASSTLTLQVYGAQNQTSLTFGTTSACSQVTIA